MAADGSKASEKSPVVSSSRAPWVLVLVPVLFLVWYARSLDYEFVWTDQGEIVMGLMIRPISDVDRIFLEPMVVEFDDGGTSVAPRYYRPLQVAALSAIDHSIGRRPRNFRALNIALGIVTAWTVAWIAFALFGNTAAALFAGAIYVLHPANLETYVWIAGLSHALAACFMAASLAFGIAWRRRASWLAAAGCIGSLVLALLSKENAVVTPALLFLVAVAMQQMESRKAGIEARDGIAWPERDALMLIVIQLAVVALYLLWLRPLVLGTTVGGGELIGRSLGVHVPTVLGHWPGTMAWLLAPVVSNSSDVVELLTSVLRPEPLLALLLLAGSIALYSRWTRRGLEVAALGLAWIWIAFAPTSGLLPLNHVRGERYVALSLFGLALLLPALARFVANRVGNPRARAALVALCVLLLGFYAERSARRMPEWKDERTLFEADVARDPLYREAYLQLALLSIRDGDYLGGKETLEALRRIGPAFIGHVSYLNPNRVVSLYCGVNLELGRAKDSLDFFADLEASSERVTAMPALAYCAARSFVAAGEHRRGAAILRKLFFRTRAYSNAETAVEIARAYALAGDREAAQMWLTRVSMDDADKALRARAATVRALLRRSRDSD